MALHELRVGPAHRHGGARLGLPVRRLARPDDAVRRAPCQLGLLVRHAHRPRVAAHQIRRRWSPALQRPLLGILHRIGRAPRRVPLRLGRRAAPLGLLARARRVSQRAGRLVHLLGAHLRRGSSGYFFGRRPILASPPRHVPFWADEGLAEKEEMRWMPTPVRARRLRRLCASDPSLYGC